MNIALILFVPMLLLTGGLVLWSILTETTLGLPNNSPRPPRGHKKGRGRHRTPLNAEACGDAPDLISAKVYLGTGTPPPAGIDEGRDPLGLIRM